MKPDWSCVLFDLDGTIVDSAPGITAALAWTFERLERPIPSPAELLLYVGPPILDSFRDRAGMSEKEARHALATYRPHYLATGVFNSSVYPGVADTIKAVHAAGIPLSLATSKPESLATVTLDYFGLAKYFKFLTGASEDEKRSAKADVVAYALARLAESGVDISRPVMIGDRGYDVEGAAANNVPTIFVEWGYGSPAEQAGAIGVAKDAGQLQAMLLGQVT
ncbi:MAG: haloacid dehalogenase [Microbacteriaceae bacterium]|nr:haloacid dehalogenase [Microbacteriaceae bacterium]